MTESLDRILRLVSEGHMTAEEAAPIIDALERAGRPAESRSTAGRTPADQAPAGAQADGAQPRFARIEVRESGRRIVDLRVPISLGRFALSRVPGLSREQIAEVEEAVTTGVRGPILDVEDPDGDGVRIVLE
jgi:hypothetical protein